MQTQIQSEMLNTSAGREADGILRNCVHCGFCTATCPTYQLLGDELDGPRGRIYLIKQMLEGQEVGRHTQGHLDRCLTCRACETTCPSGVQYGHLAEIGRGILEERVRRPWPERLLRRALRAVLPYRRRFTALLRLGQLVRSFLPSGLKASIPPRQTPPVWPAARHARRMLVLEGCVQPGLAPQINAASARVLDRLGISLIQSPDAGCCGALSYHLSAHDEGLGFMRRNIDAWWPQIEAGVEAIVMTASGCGATVKDYGHLLRDDPLYAAKAARVSSLTRDLGEILSGEEVARLAPVQPAQIAFHAPCSLQHGQKLPGLVEAVLTKAGFVLTPVPDAHLCCGSAGTYSILQPGLATSLRDNKLAALQSGQPTLIATANIGCLMHLQGGTALPVCHWIELLDSPVSLE